MSLNHTLNTNIKVEHHIHKFINKYLIIVIFVMNIFKR